MSSSLLQQFSFQKSALGIYTPVQADVCQTMWETYKLAMTDVGEIDCQIY